MNDQHVEVYQESDQVRDLLHPDAPPTASQAYRIRIGHLEVTYSVVSGAVYINLPGHKDAALPLHSHVYCHDENVMIHVDHDQHGRPVGIEIL